MTEKFHTLNIPYSVDVRFVDSGVDCADASSASAMGRDVGFARRESSYFKKTRKVAEFDMSHPTKHQSPATVSVMRMYFILGTWYSVLVNVKSE
jgi:hypothetical protein